MEYEWKKSTQKYSTAENLFLNGVRIGSYWWAMTCKGEDAAYDIDTLLPGFKLKQRRFKTADEAKCALEKFSTWWVKRITTPPTRDNMGE